MKIIGNLTLQLKNIAVLGDHQLQHRIVGVDLGKIEVQVKDDPSFLPVIRIQTECSNDYELELIVPDLSTAESLFECMVRIEPTKDKCPVDETIEVTYPPYSLMLITQHQCANGQKLHCPFLCATVPLQPCSRPIFERLVPSIQEKPCPQTANLRGEGIDHNASASASGSIRVCLSFD